MPAIGIGVGIGFNNQIKKERMPNINYLFVDGGYFDRVINKVSREFFESDNPIPINYLRTFGSFQKTFYYHSLPSKREKESSENFEVRLQKKKNLFNELRLLPNVHVFEGLTSGKGKNARQKGVDIMIAVDMLRHSFRGNMNRATLLTGDLDFKPLLEALIWEGMFTTLFYSKYSISNQLLFAADTTNRFSISTIHNWVADEYKDKFTIPVQLYNEKQFKQGSLIEKGRLTKMTWELYQVNDISYFINIINGNSISAQWHYNNLKKLKIFIEDQYNSTLTNEL